VGECTREAGEGLRDSMGVASYKVPEALVRVQYSTFRIPTSTVSPRSSQKLRMFSTAPWTLLSSKFAGFGRSRLQRVFKRVDKRLTLTDTTVQAHLANRAMF
jgi:hypothetical protein